MNRDQPLDNNFVSNEADIREMDVLNGRGKVDHRKLYSFRSCLWTESIRPSLTELFASCSPHCQTAGNAFYRQAILEHCTRYKEYWLRKDRKGMDLIVQSIIDKVHGAGGRFMEQNWRKMWIEVSPKVRKQKVERYVLN